MKKKIVILISFVLVFILLAGCGSNKPTRPAKPAPNAVWVPGHWKWAGPPARKRKVWIPGHWRVK